MKKTLIALLVAGSSFGALPVTSGGAYQLDRASKLNLDQKVGTNLYNAQQFGMKAVWSYAIQGGAANSDLTLQDPSGAAAKLPTGAIIKDCMIDVVTTPTSSTSSGTLAFSSNAVADLKAAALGHTGYLSSTGEYACIPDGTVGNAIQMASEATLKVRIGSEALTAGKINIWVEFVLSE